MQQGLFPQKESSDSSNIFRTPGLYPQVNVKVRRRNNQQLSAFQSLFGQLNDSQHEEPHQSPNDQVAITRSNSALENSLLCSNIRISFDPPTPAGSKSRDDSFYSCASEFENDISDNDQEQQRLVVLRDNEQQNHEDQETNEIKQTDDDQFEEEYLHDDDEFKSISGDIFDQSGSVLSGKAGSSQTQFYTPKLLSLDGNFGNNAEKKNKNGIGNNNESHYEMRINRDTVSIEEDVQDQIVNANRKTSNTMNQHEKKIANKSPPAEDRLSHDSKQTSGKTQLYRNLLEASPYSPDAPQTKSRNAPSYQPPPLALSIDVRNTPKICAEGNIIDAKINSIVESGLKTRLKSMSQQYLQKNQQSTAENSNNSSDNQESINKRRGVSSATGQAQQQKQSTTQPSLFQTSSLAKKKAFETKKRAFQSFQVPLQQQKGSKSFRTPFQFPMQNSNQDGEDDSCSLARSAPGNHKDHLLQSQQVHDASIPNSSYAVEKEKATIKKNLQDQFSYYSSKARDWSGKGVSSTNRLIDRKNLTANSTDTLRKNTGQGWTLNLTLLISVILEKHPGLLYVLSLNHMIGTCARGGLYFLVTVLSGKDIEFLIGFAPLLFFSRLYYTVSMYYLLFYFEQKSVSFRQISKIFNAPFSRLRTRVDRSLAAEIINDNMNNTRYHAEIIAKRFFALCPVELNFIALSQITSGRKSNLYYISNFIYQGIESILLYPPAIIYCYLKNTKAEVVGIDFLQITKYVSVLALIIFSLFCSYLLVFGNRYLKKI